MSNDLTSLLGRNLDDVIRSPFVLALGERTKTELIEDRFYMEMPQSGLSFVAPLDGRVMTIQLYSEGHQNYRKYGADLPEGVTFADGRAAVRSRLGPPTASGGGKVIAFFGKAPAWDRYAREAYSLHLQYTEGEERIDLVSLIRADAVPKTIA